MKDINLKRMAKDMSFQDKAKLLFADHIRQCDTKGRERVLTGEEENAIVKDLQDKNQIKEANRITRLFNMNLMACLDVQTHVMDFDAALLRMEMFILGMVLQNRKLDIIGDVLQVARNKKCGCLNEIEKKVSGHLGDASGFYAFAHGDEKDEEGKGKTVEGEEPNRSFQKAFVHLLSADRKLRKALYVLKVLSRKAGMDLMTQECKEIVAEAESRLGTIRAEDDFLRLLRVYRTAMETGLVRKDNFTEPRFLAYLLDPEQALQLAAEDMREVEDMLTRRKWEGFDAHPLT